MPLIPKPNYNQIFASQAPDIDKPAVFNNYPEGWGPESRPNNGKPTIKGFNYVQQTSDLKDLWILQNGACLPYDESIEYAEGAPVLKDGVIQYKTADGFSPAISEKPYILKYFTEGVLYPLNARVILENGDIVKNTVDGNTVDPNVDMTGWKNPWVEQAAKNLDAFCFDDVLTANQIANSTSTNLASKLQEVGDNPDIKTIILKRKYYINSPVTFSRSIKIEWVGDGELVFGLTGGFTASGNAQLLGKLGDNATKYTSSVLLPSGHNLNANDTICIFNAADFSFSPHRSNYKDGQFAKIESLVGNQASIYDMLYSNFDTSCDVYKVNPISITLVNPKFSVLYKSNLVPFRIAFAAPKIQGLQSSGGLRYGLELSKCFGGYVIGADATLTAPSVDGYQYPIVISNCQDLVLTGGRYSSARHGIAFGGYADACSVPNRNITVTHATVMTTSTTGIGGADIHGNAENVKYDDCVIRHASVGGKNISLVDCTIYGRPLVDGCCVWFGELIGGLIELKRCKLISNGDGHGGGNFGYIHAYFDKPLLEDIFFDIDDITLFTPNSTGLSKVFNLIMVKDTVLSKKVNLSITRPKIVSPSLLNFATLRAGVGSTTKIPVGTIVIDDIISAPPCSFIHALTDLEEGYSLTLQRQYGSQTLNTGDGNQSLVTGSPVTLKYNYPVLPNLIMGVSTDVSSTWNAAFLNTGVSAAPYNGVYSSATLRTNAVTPVLNTTANKLPAGKNIVVSWSVGVRI